MSHIMSDTVRSVREIGDIGIASRAVPDMQNHDRFAGDRVIDAVRIAGCRQDADVGVTRPHAKPGIMAQALHALAEVIADTIGSRGASFGHEVLTNGRKVIPGLNVKPKLQYHVLSRSSLTSASGANSPRLARSSAGLSTASSDSERT